MTQTIREDIQNFDQVLNTHQPATVWEGLGALLLKACGEATSIPTTGSAGYGPGHLIKLTTAVAASGQCPLWVNIGTSASCLFVPIGPVAGYGFAMAGGLLTTAGGDTTEVIQTVGGIIASDVSLVEYSVTNDDDTIVSQIATAEKITVVCSVDPSTDHALQWAVLRNGCVPQYDVFAGGTRVAIVADTTTVPITVTGVRAGDIAFATIKLTDDTDRLVCAACTANTLTLKVDADPGTTHAWQYVVLRPRGSFKPSHYIVAAGVHTTTADGAGLNEIALTGVTATDIAIVQYNTTDDTDYIVNAVCSTNKLSVVMSANPGTTHKLTYVVLRAY